VKGLFALHTDTVTFTVPSKAATYKAVFAGTEDLAASHAIVAVP
jgi:hypothetical protein